MSGAKEDRIERIHLAYHNNLNLLLRKLAPLERHYYHSDQYLYDGTYFWLVLDASGDKQEIESKLHQLEEGAKKYVESENT